MILRHISSGFTVQILMKDPGAFSRGILKSKPHLSVWLRFYRLRGQDSNLRPIGYTYPYITVGVDYIIIRSNDFGCEALRADFSDLLPCGIVSEPSMTYVRAWLLIALRIALGVPAIHLIFNTDFSGKAAI
jgi:hypothetical protein